MFTKLLCWLDLHDWDIFFSIGKVRPQRQCNKCFLKQEYSWELLRWEVISYVP